MTCETCNATCARTRECAPEGHTHKICPACVGRFWEGNGQPIRCPDVGWNGRPDPELTHPPDGAVKDPPPTDDSPETPEDDEKPPF